MELESRFPSPSLFPNGSGLSRLLGAWADEHLFRPGAALSMSTNADIPEIVLNDRRAFFTFLDFDQLHDQTPQFYGQFAAQLHALESVLDSGSDYLLGDTPSWADVLAYFPLWMARGNIALIDDLLSELDATRGWELRMQAIGHGKRRDLDDAQALSVAARSKPTASSQVMNVWPKGLAPGDEVAVTPLDYGATPVHGMLLRHTHEEISILRDSALVGEVAVHFPKIGYDIRGI